MQEQIFTYNYKPTFDPSCILTDKLAEFLHVKVTKRHFKLSKCKSLIFKDNEVNPKHMVQFYFIYQSLYRSFYSHLRKSSLEYLTSAHVISFGSST